MFLHFKNANSANFKESLYSIVVKKMYTKISSVHGSSVLTVILQHVSIKASCLVVIFSASAMIR